jgi:hypothetical protein
MRGGKYPPRSSCSKHATHRLKHERIPSEVAVHDWKDILFELVYNIVSLMPKWHDWKEADPIVET